MKKDIAYFLIIIWSFSIINGVVTVKVNEYLENQSKLLEDELSQQESVQKTDPRNTLTSIIQEKDLPEIHEYVKFSIQNKTYLLIKKDIYELDIRDSDMHLLSQNISLERASESEIITFVKGTVFENTTFIILTSKLMGEAYIYVSSNDAFTLVETLFVPDATDAHFFINNKNLYLIVTSNKEDCLAVTWVYKWFGLHFDEIQTIFTTGAIKVNSFTTPNAEIIVILQNKPNNTVPSLVYEFSNNEIRKIQHIRTFHPVNMELYISKNRNYLIIYNENKHNTIYYWDGFEIVVQNRFITDNVILITTIFNINDTSHLAVAYNDHIDIYNLGLRNIRKEMQVTYKSNYSRILDVNIGINDTIYVIGEDNKTIKIKLFATKMSLIQKDLTAMRSDEIRTCFINLDGKLTERENLFTQKDYQPSKDILMESLHTEPEIETLTKEIKEKINNVSTSADQYTVPVGNSLIINGYLTVKGKVSVENINVSDVSIKKINGKRWTPERWLKYKEPQTIKGVSIIKSLTANHMETTRDDPIFTDMLLTRGNQNFTEPLFIENLTANAMNAKTINSVEVDNVYSQARPQKIKGIKTFKNLHVIEARTNSINDEIPDDTLSAVANEAHSPSNFDFEMEIENLEVESINGVPWDNFKNSVFRTFVDKEIIGPLNFTYIKVTDLHTTNINNISVDSLLTVTTDQVINADVEVEEVIVEGDILAETVNGKEFTPENLYFIKNDEVVTDPVSFANVIVRNNLNLSENSFASLVANDSERLLGTNESDFMQIYNDKVTINGDLFLNVLQIFPNTELVVSDEVIDPHLSRTYWTKNTIQEIPVKPHFKSLNTPHLITDLFNGVKTTQFLLNDNTEKIESDFSFSNVTVLGNVVLGEAGSHIPDLEKISREAVKRSGSQTIHGKKNYLDTLSIDVLETKILGDINVSDAINSKALTNVTGRKTIKNLIVEGDIDCNLKNIKSINDVALGSIREKYVFIDQPHNFSNLDFHILNVTNLTLKNINGHDLTVYYSLAELLNSTEMLHNLTINGNVSIDNIKNMSSLNDISYQDLLEHAPHIGQHGFLDKIKFSKEIKVDNLIASSINDLDLRNITQRVLTRHRKQKITAPFTFENIKTENLLTPQINDIMVKNILNTRSLVLQTLSVPNGTIFSEVVLQSINASTFSPCSIESIRQELADPPTQKWTKVEIKGNVTLLDEKSILYRVFEKAVNLDSRNVIHAPVNISESVLLTNLNTVKPINGTEILDLLEDAVLSESNEPQTERILNTDPENIVHLDKPRIIKEAIFDRVAVENNLNINFYDKHNFTDAMLNRLFIDGNTSQVAQGTYYFDNVDSDNFITPFINGIPINDIIFDLRVQNISGNKHFIRPIRISGNVSIDFINGANVTERFENAIPLEGPVISNGNVTILLPTSNNGSIQAEFINGQPVARINNILSSSDRRLEMEEIFSMKTELETMVKKMVPLVKRLSEEFMYLEKSDALQVEMPNSLRASSIVSAEDEIVILINGFKSGSYCGLPNNCSCAVQSSIVISPHSSVNVFPNSGVQRFFSYDDGNTTINFITNSVSTSSHCRTNKDNLINEISIMTWTTKTRGNKKGSFYQYNTFFTGYISKVDFFTLNDKTYAVIGRYYDPILDSYDLDCTIIQISEDKTHALEIQRIRTKGVIEVYLMQTAQGVVLVLGNQTPNDVHHENEFTNIYRFNPNTEQFIFMRTIPSFGCSTATGIVLGTDSLLALAHSEAPVQVLKYYPEFDNYYFYQSFPLEDHAIGISTFYTKGIDITEAYLCIVTSSERYYIYSYRYLEGFKLKCSGVIEGLTNIIPLNYNKQLYLFAGSAKSSSLLTVVKSGSD
uniref:Uncharacterized protein LOC114333090 n=1 Tax=Diabrotica virgifera virgifera TaxID=50390 RepID=A0A6P7FVF0_DIAVI